MHDDVSIRTKCWISTAELRCIYQVQDTLGGCTEIAPYHAAMMSVHKGTRECTLFLHQSAPKQNLKSHHDKKKKKKKIKSKIPVAFSCNVIESSQIFMLKTGD